MEKLSRETGYIWLHVVRFEIEVLRTRCVRSQGRVLGWERLICLYDVEAKG